MATTIITVGFILMVAAIILFLSLKMPPPRGGRTRQEEYLPHGCPEGGFTACALAHPMELEGGRGLWIFDGLFCERCNREIACARCGKVPEAGSVVEERALTTAVSCCERPMYRLRAGGRTLEAPPGPDDGGQKTKWLN